MGPHAPVGNGPASNGKDGGNRAIYGVFVAGNSVFLFLRKKKKCMFCKRLVSGFRITGLSGNSGVSGLCPHNLTYSRHISYSCLGVDFMMKSFLAAAAVGLVALSAGPSAASTVKLDYVGSSVFGAPNLSETVRIEGPGRAATTVRAGPFRMTDRTDDFVLWCFDIAQAVGNHVTYTEVSNPLGDVRASLLNRLFTSYYSQVTTPLNGAAFQVALWEIVNETIPRRRAPTAARERPSRRSVSPPRDRAADSAAPRTASAAPPRPIRQREAAGPGAEMRPRAEADRLASVSLGHVEGVGPGEDRLVAVARAEHQEGAVSPPPSRHAQPTTSSLRDAAAATCRLG
jgi:hypothetical protein